MKPVAKKDGGLTKGHEFSGQKSDATKSSSLSDGGNAVVSAGNAATKNGHGPNGHGANGNGGAAKLSDAEVKSIYSKKLLERAGVMVKTDGPAARSEQFAGFQTDAPACDNCGAITVRNGNCYLCHNCGNSMGCS